MSRIERAGGHLEHRMPWRVSERDQARRSPTETGGDFSTEGLDGGEGIGRYEHLGASLP